MKKIISVIILIVILSNVGIVPVDAAYTSTNDGCTVANYAKAAVGTHKMSREGLCQTFAWECLYNTLGISNKAGCGCCATKAWQSYGVSSSRDDIPLGAAVYFGGSSTRDSECGQEAGHVGIYIGNNEIAHAWSSTIICKTTIDYVIDCGYYYRGWGWQGGHPLATGDFFDFWGVDNNITISGTYKFWWKQEGYGNCDVNVDINGQHLQTLYQDGNGYFSYEFDTTKYANGTYTFGAIIRNTSGAEKYVTRTININNSNSPVVNIDVCVGGEGTIRLHGWAFDKDDYSLPVELHVYVGAAPPDGRGYRITANKYRPDVNNVYGCGDYHGFDSTLNVSLAGDAIDVYVYGINSIGSGSNYLVKKYTVKITDSTPPTINDLEITYIDSTKYTVSCKVSDNVAIDRVSFPTWTSNNAQDDIVWYSADIKDGIATKTITIDDHNNEYGAYNTHIYAYDTSGNVNWAAFDQISIFKDETAPVISNAKITNVDSAGYTLQCDITDDMMVGKVKFPTWTVHNGHDDIIWYEIIPESNTVTCQIKTSDHNNENGYYRTHIYAYDTSGNVSLLSDLTWILPLDSFNISFDSNGGNTINETKTIGYGEEYGDLPVPEYKGYTFKGWYTTREDGELILPSTSYNIADHQTLYARWEESSPFVDSVVYKNGNTFKINPTIYNIDREATIIVAGYKEKRLIDVSYNNQSLPHTLIGDIDEIKVMVWNSLSELMPLCNAKVIPSSEFITE